MRAHRFVTALTAAALAAGLSGCVSPPSPPVREPDPVPILAREGASLGGAVLAIRLSPQLPAITAGEEGGYVLLVDEDGGAVAVEVGAVDAGRLAWGAAGLFVSGPTEELLLTDGELTALPRGSTESYETARFLTADGGGFLALYNVGFGEGAYLHRVVAGDGARLSSWEAEGIFTSVSDCGGTVVGITDLADTTLGAAGPAEGAPADSASGRPADATHGLIQLFPRPAEGDPGPLATARIEGTLEGAAADAPCAEGVTHTLGFHEAEAGEGPGVPVLRSWDTRSGEHALLPLRDGEGLTLGVTLDEVSMVSGRVEDGRYRWVTPSGRVFVTDLATGTTEHAFDIPLDDPASGEARVLVTEEAIVVLDVVRGGHADSGGGGGPVLELSRYDADSGERRSLLGVAGAGGLYDGSDMVIRDVAVRPAWLEDRARG